MKVMSVRTVCSAIMRRYFVYIMASRSRVLYVGVTNDLARRVNEHKSALTRGFTSKYRVNRLVYFEEFTDIRVAIAREKELKGWKRCRKIELIEESNLTWDDLSPPLYFFRKSEARLSSCAARAPARGAKDLLSVAAKDLLSVAAKDLLSVAAKDLLSVAAKDLSEETTKPELLVSNSKNPNTPSRRPAMDTAVLARLTTLERSNRRLQLVLVAIVTLLLPLVLLGLRPQSAASGTFQIADSIRVRQVIVVDSAGTVRARLGSHLPDAVIDGRRMYRGEEIAGLLIYDDGGAERGGYVTFAPSRNVALTLDTRHRQAALFVADPEDGVAARVWGGNNWAEFRANAQAAHLNIGEAGALVVKQPPFSETETAQFCADFKAEVAQRTPPSPPERQLANCKQRMPDGACRKCLGLP